MFEPTINEKPRRVDASGDAAEAVPRASVVDMVAASRIPILSYHFPFPGVGHVAKWGDRYRFYPSDLSQAADPAGRP